MDWEDCLEPLCYFTLGLFVISLIIGIPTTCVGALSRGVMVGPPFLTSIPLCPIGTGLAKSYIGATLPGSGVCSSATVRTVSVSLSLSSSFGPDREQTAYLVHNLWNYNGSISLRNEQLGPAAYHFRLSRELNLSNAAGRSSVHQSYSTLFPDEFLVYGNIALYCPHPTLISSQLEPFCNKTGGYPFNSGGPFEILDLGPITYSTISDTLVNIVFDDFTALPTDYVTTPQLYWISWGDQRSNAVLITGIFFMSLAGLMIVAIIGEFFLAASLSPTS